jgi:hypothetical protein
MEVDGRNVWVTLLKCPLSFLLFFFLSKDLLLYDKIKKEKKEEYSLVPMQKMGEKTITSM